jgi:hypothetical protein
MWFDRAQHYYSRSSRLTTAMAFFQKKRQGRTFIYPFPGGLAGPLGLPGPASLSTFSSFGSGIGCSQASAPSFFLNANRIRIPGLPLAIFGGHRWP